MIKAITFVRVLGLITLILCSDFGVGTREHAHIRPGLVLNQQEFLTESFQVGIISEYIFCNGVLIMARPREFEPNKALKQAMFLFWRKGYEDTSMTELVETTGVSRYGFYNEFGDKHDLFLKCMDHYAHTAIEMVLSPMERPNASLPEIRHYFDQLLQDASQSRPPMGCLIGNTAMSSPEWDAAVSNRIDHHFNRMRAAFLNALQNAVQSGHLPPNEDVEALADYLVGIATGYLSAVRSMSPEAIRRYFKVALRQLEPGSV